MSKKIFEVRVTEYLQCSIAIEAESEEDALRIAEEDWQNALLILTPDDSMGAEYHLVGEIGSEQIGRVQWHDNGKKVIQRENRGICTSVNQKGR